MENKPMEILNRFQGFYTFKRTDINETNFIFHTPGKGSAQSGITACNSVYVAFIPASGQADS